MGPVHCHCSPSRVPHICGCFREGHANGLWTHSTIYLWHAVYICIEMNLDSLVFNTYMMTMEWIRSVSFWYKRHPFLCSFSMFFPSIFAINTLLNQSSISFTVSSIPWTSWNSLPQPNTLRITVWHRCNAWCNCSSLSLGFMKRLSFLEVANAQQRSSRKRHGVWVTTLMSRVEIPCACWSQ